MRAPFGARVTTAVSLRGPLCVGIDPHPGLLAAWDRTASRTLSPGSWMARWTSS